MMWQHYVMNDHCPEYEYLTMEEKLLVAIEMREWLASMNLQDLCMPVFVYKLTESRIIEKIKEEDERRKARDANDEAGVVSKKRNACTRQGKAR